jgi:RNA polymerase sigma-70 factor (ECF subfamily)
MDPAEELERIREQILVLRAQRGGAEAFRALVDRYEHPLLYFIRRIVGRRDRALDALQEVWLTVFRRIRGLRCPGAFRVWLYKIAHDKAVDLVRRQYREEERQEEALEVRGENSVVANDEPALVENAELVHRALEALSLKHREVLTLRFLEDLSLEEIAHVLTCQLGTVKSRLHYAKQALRRKVKELSDE